MPSYDSFMCPNCENHFRVIWPAPLPNYTDPCSKVKMKCPDCGEVTELYDFLIDRIMCAPDPSTPTVHGLVEQEKVGCFPVSPTLHDSTMQEFQCQATIRLCVRIANTISV